METRKVRWGVIGATSRVAQSKLLPAIMACPHSTLAAVASRRRESAEEIAGQFGPGVHAFGDYDSLIADAEVDVIYIPLPNALHLGWAVEAMNNGKHVLCEQPLALNAQEASEMVETAQANGVVLSEAFMYRYHPLQEQVFDRVARAGLGAIQLVRASFSFVQTDPEDTRNPAQGSGALLDLGCYCVHIARTAFGREPVAATAQSIADEETGLDLTTTATLEFEDGGVAQIDCSYAMTFRASYEIVGTHGSVTVPQFFGLGDSPGQFLLTTPNGQSQLFEASGDMYSAEVTAMSRRILGEDGFLLPAEDALANLRALDAVAASARSGRRMSV